MVYRWGGDVLNPTTLTLPPKSDVEVTQVAISRNSKTGVTSKGRLITWDVSSLRDILHFIIICDLPFVFA